VTTALRLAVEADAAAIAAIYAPAVTERATSFEVVAPDAAEMALRIDRLRARFPWLACEHHGTLAGYAYAGPHRDRAAYQWSVEVSAYVRADLQRAGVARALYTSLLAVLELQGFRTACAGVTLPNPASEGLHSAMGFTPVGVYHSIGYKFGRWHDVAWSQRSIGAYEPDPPPPRPLVEVTADPRFGRALASGEALVRLP
jgi:L-amino acid N-acyltransferase YncA